MTRVAQTPGRKGVFVGLPLLIIAFCLITAFGITLAVLTTRNRSRALERQARKLGFSFAPCGKPFQGTSVRGQTVLEDDASISVENLLRGVVSGREVLIFDVTLCVESSTSAVVTSCAAFRAERLPAFQIGWKSFIRKMEEALGMKSLHFDTDQEFTRHYYVHCVNEPATRAFLTAAKLQQLRRYAHYYRIETSPDWLFLYHPGMTVRPEQLPQFLSETATLADVLLSDSPERLQVPA